MMVYSSLSRCREEVVTAQRDAAWCAFNPLLDQLVILKSQIDAALRAVRLELAKGGNHGPA